jgi:glycosyltransferase involved in cell wall biosynthesis
VLKVLVVGQTPPPYGGTPLMIERLVKCNFADVKLIHVRMDFASHIKEHGKIYLWKVLQLFAVIARIFYHRIVDRPRILYYVPAGPDRVTVLRDLPILLSTRWLFEKTVFHFHLAGVSGLYNGLPSWQRWFFRRAYFGADAAIRISELNPDDGRRLDAKHEFVIPNGIEDPYPGFNVARSSRPISESFPLRILFVGMLRESKGVLVLIDACGKLAARGVPFHLEIMGQWKSDDFAARVHQRIGELNLTAHIHFLGVLIGDEKFASYRRADVFCFPTFFSSESFGLVLLEAMACGLPVVATRWRGIPSVVDNGMTGLLVEPRDADALAHQLFVLAYDPDLRHLLGRAGRAKFKRKYTLDRHAERMRHALLETAGLAVAEAPEEVDRPSEEHRTDVIDVESRTESHTEPASV